MENRRGKLVTVFAGYQKQMEGVLAYNEGIPPRFPLVFVFPDFSDIELFAILQGIMKNDPSEFKMQDDKYGHIAVQRLGRQRGTVGFGNARAVRNAYEQAVSRQSARVLSERREGGEPDLLLISRQDLLGPKFLDVSTSSALRELQVIGGSRLSKSRWVQELGCAC
jgi:hypothetical protein